VALNRRVFLELAAGGLMVSTLQPPPPAEAGARSRFKAVAFDAFPIFDPRPIFALAETLLPGRGTELSDAWRARQFEYQWLRTLAGHYADFWQTTEDALRFAAKSLHLELSPENRSRLMQAYLGLQAWPDVPSALAALKDAGLRLVFLSNMTPALLDAGIENSGLHGMFERILSTDRIRAYKPEPRAYQLALDALGLPRDEIVFAAFAGWDVSGAKWFGYPTFWVNRLGVPAEELGPAADAMGRDLNELVSFVKSPR
jgi:2-haloacid dehalogenase